MRKIRHIAALGVCVIVAAGMSACGPTRSIDAYCGVMGSTKRRKSPPKRTHRTSSVSEYWSTQQATAEQMVTDPFAGLAGALTGGMMNSGSLMRVDEYTAANCPTVGRMF